MNKFTKKDLRNRMVVVLRDGTTWLYVDELLIGKSSWAVIHDYDDDLSRSFGNKERDIMKVYNDVWALEDIYNTNRDVLWERSEVKEVTMKEVCEKFGCEVKIISEEEQ